MDSGDSWVAADRGLSSEFERLTRSIGVERGLEVDAIGETVELRTNGSDRALAATLRAAIGVLLSREHSRGPRDRERRQWLEELDVLLQPAIDPNHRLRITFPSRRQADQLDRYGYDGEQVAALVGLPHAQATDAARALGLRLSTAIAKMNRDPSQLDVYVDADGFVSSIAGLHVD